MERAEAIERLKQNKAAAEFYVGIAQNIKPIENELKDIEAFDMAIEALSKPNYESDNEVRLAVTDRNKDKVVLWDAFGEVEYYPNGEINCVNCPHYYETEDDTGVHGHCKGGDDEMNEVKSPYMQHSPNGADLISRQNAIKVIRSTVAQYVPFLNGVNETLPMECEIALRSVPSAETKTGKWEWSDEDASWKCGCCDFVFEEFDWKPVYNFCPNCGADMRGDK